MAAAQPALAARQNATSVSYALATTTTPSLSITPQAPVALPPGVSVAGRGGTVLLVTSERPLRPGRYTLTLRQRHAGRWVTTRAPIMLN